jgi:hypothetical protein
MPKCFNGTNPFKLVAIPSVSTHPFVHQGYHSVYAAFGGGGGGTGPAGPAGEAGTSMGLNPSTLLHILFTRVTTGPKSIP